MSTWMPNKFRKNVPFARKITNDNWQLITWLITWSKKSNAKIVIFNLKALPFWGIITKEFTLMNQTETNQGSALSAWKNSLKEETCINISNMFIWGWNNIPVTSVRENLLLQKVTSSNTLKNIIAKKSEIKHHKPKVLSIFSWINRALFSKISALEERVGG